MSSAGSSQYRTLARHLMDGIARGDFPVGSYLPSEQALGEQYGVSRVTVRGALRELEQLGLISRRPRLGTRVESSHAISEFMLVGDSLDAVLRFTRDLPFVLLRSESILLDVRQADELQLLAKQRYSRVTGLRSRPDAAPTLFSEHLIPALYAVDPELLDGLTGSIAEFLAQRRSDDIHRINQVIDVARLSSEQARHLHVPNKSPALRTRRWYRNRNADLVMMSTSLSPEGRYAMTSILQRSPR